MNHSRPAGDPYRPERRDQRASPPLPPSVRTITSQSIFLGAHEIGIEHHGALYRLKITRQGKLILNK